VVGGGSQAWLDDLLHAQGMSGSARNPKHLYPTLFVGESEHGLYALNTFVDERTITIAHKYLGPPVLEGPMPIAVEVSSE
jgi:hypothetical protein